MTLSRTTRPAGGRCRLLCLVCWLAVSSAAAQSGVTEHRWLFGVGHENVLDTYLSPLDYTGTAVSFLHRSERAARIGRLPASSVVLQTSANAGYLHSPTDNGKELDAQFSIGGGVTAGWQLAPRWHLAAGALVQGSVGFTYNTRNGNNPAQGRLAVELVPTVSGSYAFPLWRRTWLARAQVDAPLLGAMFSPAYGQTYYEIFSLGQSDHNVRFTHPFNAPTLRLLTTLDVPLTDGTTLSLGYHADIRQSHVNHLKRHAWHNAFVIGFVRHLQLIKTPRHE